MASSLKLTRRAVLGSAAAVAGSASLNRAAALQTPTFSREAKLTAWGFGAEETNPMAYSRVEAFRAAYPTIELELVPNFDDQQLLTGFASDQLPDLIWMGRDKLAGWAKRGVFSPLDDYLADGSIDSSQFYPSAWEQVQVDGQVYGIPQFIDVRALYVNNDAITQLGQDPAALDTSNWDALADLGAQLVVKNGDAYERWGFDHKIQAQWLWLWARGNGGQLMSEDGQEITFDDEKAVDALNWGKNAYDAQGGFSAYEALASTWQGDEQFARGQVAMTMYENWMLGIISRVAPELQFSVLPIKQRGGEEMVSFTGGLAWTIPSGANDPEAAWEFIKFMANAETWMIGAKATKDSRVSDGVPFIPSLTGNQVVDQRQIDELYEPIAGPFDAAVQLFPQLLQAGFSLPLSKSVAGAQIADALQNTGVLPALRGEASPEDALKDADQEAEDAADSAS